MFSVDAGYTFPLELLVSPDGRNLAYNAPTSFSGAAGDRAPIHVIVNWRSLLPDGW